MKKFKLLITITLILLTLFSIFNLKNISYIIADDSKTSEYVEKLSNNIFKQLNDIDLSELDKILENLDSKFDIFGTGNFKDKINEIVSGKYFSSYDNLFQIILSVVIDNLINMLPLILTIIAICVLGSIVSNLKSGSNEGVSTIIHFVTYAVVILILVTAFTQIMNTTLKTLNNMSNLMQASFPILLTMLTAVGALTSVSIYKPIVAILTGGVTVVFTNFLYPLFIISFVFLIISNLSTTVKLNKFNEFISSTFKYVVGLVSTLFSAFLMIQGISAGKFDSVSIKATKFAVKSYVPIIGSFISDGFDFIVLSSVLIKNAIGVGVLFLIIMAILTPILKIVLFKLSLQLTSAIIEPIGNSKITSFTSGCAKILVYPIAILAGVAFMFILTVALIMTTANIF